MPSKIGKESVTTQTPIGLEVLVLKILEQNGQSSDKTQAYNLTKYAPVITQNTIYRLTAQRPHVEVYNSMGHMLRVHNQAYIKEI